MRNALFVLCSSLKTAYKHTIFLMQKVEKSEPKLQVKALTENLFAFYQGQIIPPLSMGWRKKTTCVIRRCFHLKSSNKLSRSVALLNLLKIQQFNQVLIKTGTQKDT